MGDKEVHLTRNLLFVVLLCVPLLFFFLLKIKNMVPVYRALPVQFCRYVCYSEELPENWGNIFFLMVDNSYSYLRSLDCTFSNLSFSQLEKFAWSVCLELCAHVS